MARTKQTPRRAATWNPRRATYNSGTWNPLCGCYVIINNDPKYLPQVKVDVHATIIDNISRTVLTQTFVNPSDKDAVDEVSYMFPLYDGASVARFTCTVGDRIIDGVVKERQKAKKEYFKAKAEGKTAALLEQSLSASDVFSTMLGNIPAGQEIIITITYLGELKHDAETDGVRLTIPTYIAPRYGSAMLPTSGSPVQEQGMSIVVDTEMPEGSSISSIQSPSHPIAVSIGKISTDVNNNNDLSLRKASATLTQDVSQLEKDFVINVAATGVGEPSAFVENHPEIPNQRALMATLVPKFNISREKPEIVFLCDRSGSMTGKIPNLVSALQIFLRSLPVGVKFNICSFGSSFDFLWKKSRTYNQDTLTEADAYVNDFNSTYGGTEIYGPMEAAFKSRYRDMNMELFLLTDGEIWSQEELFNLINQHVKKSKNKIRVFSLGIGSGASTALIEGVARAGNGFAQTVQDSEKMEKKVMRMLKGAQLPHIDNYTLEIKYEADNDEGHDDDFEVIESVIDSLIISTSDESEMEVDPTEETKTISLFDSNVDSNDDMEIQLNSIDTKYDHLPALASPRYLQTPTQIPPLYPFNRTTVYVILSDNAPKRKIKSIILDGRSQHGHLTLEIPVVNLQEESTTIHQLAARNEIRELEEGRGWLSNARDTDGALFKDKFECRFSDMVEREAVRLGTKFQVAGKWTSFVAVEKSQDGEETNPADEESQFDIIKASDPRPNFGAAPRMQLASKAARKSAPSTSGVKSRKKLKTKASRRSAPSIIEDEEEEEDSDDAPLRNSANKRAKRMKTASSSGSLTDPSNALQTLISLQTFSGNWLWGASLEKVLGTSFEAVLNLSLPAKVAKHKNKEEILATACAVEYLEKRCKADEELWEMLVEKARDWLRDQVKGDFEGLKKVIGAYF